MLLRFLAVLGLATRSCGGLDVHYVENNGTETASTTVVGAKDAAYLVGHELDSSGSQVHGLYSIAPYWMSGAIYDSFIHLWHLTGNDSFNAGIAVSLGNSYRTSTSNNYRPFAWNSTNDNDAQLIWAIAAMSAAETSFPQSGDPTWLTLAANAFDDVATRWDASSCGGGFVTKHPDYAPGSAARMASTPALFFQLGVRLARHTGNQTYLDLGLWAYEWAANAGLLSPASSAGAGTAVFPGVQGSDKGANTTAFGDSTQTPSHVHAAFLLGAAIVANQTAGNDTWARCSPAFSPPPPPPTAPPPARCWSSAPASRWATAPSASSASRRWRCAGWAPPLHSTPRPPAALPSSPSSRTRPGRRLPAATSRTNLGPRATWRQAMCLPLWWLWVPEAERAEEVRAWAVADADAEANGGYVRAFRRLPMQMAAIDALAAVMRVEGNTAVERAAEGFNWRNASSAIDRWTGPSSSSSSGTMTMTRARLAMFVAVGAAVLPSIV